MSKIRYDKPLEAPVWTVRESKRLIDAAPHLVVDVESLVTDRGVEVDAYYKVGIPDFVVVYATTPGGQVLVTRQYKHGLGKMTLTLPGGRLDPGETPERAGLRELLEETGYSGRLVLPTLNFVVNGNQGCGTAHFLRIADAIPTCHANSGDLEDLTLGLITEAELKQAVLRGEVGSLPHAAAIAMMAFQAV